MLRTMNFPGLSQAAVWLSLIVLLWPSMSAAQVVARFSVEPSEPGSSSGSGFVGERFRFQAQVPDASCILIDFDDGSPVQTQAGGIAVFSHPYKKVGNFTARMEAFRGADCNNLAGAPVAEELRIAVSVTPPPVLQAARPAPVVITPPPRNAPPPSLPPEIVVREAPEKVSEQWPLLRASPLVPDAISESEPPTRLPWFFMAIALALWLSKDLAPVKSEQLSFEAVKDPGRTRIGGDASAEDALTMRVVQRRPPAFGISSQARVTGSARSR